MYNEDYREKNEPCFEILGLSNEPLTRQKKINYLKEIHQKLYNDIIYEYFLSGDVCDALGVPFEFAYREKLDKSL